MQSSCREYNVPQEYSADVSQYIFTCEPLDNATEVDSVVWRRFSSIEEVLMSQSRNPPDTDMGLTSGGNVNLNSVGGITNARLTVNRTSGPKQVVFYYVPVFMGLDGTFMPTAETAIFRECSCMHAFGLVVRGNPRAMLLP